VKGSGGKGWKEILLIQQQRLPNLQLEILLRSSKLLQCTGPDTLERTQAKLQSLLNKQSSLGGNLPNPEKTLKNLQA
jgi:hypothetical protein